MIRILPLGNAATAGFIAGSIPTIASDGNCLLTSMIEALVAVLHAITSPFMPKLKKCFILFIVSFWISFIDFVP